MKNKMTVLHLSFISIMKMYSPTFKHNYAFSKSVIYEKVTQCYRRQKKETNKLDVNKLAWRIGSNETCLHKLNQNFQ